MFEELQEMIIPISLKEASLPDPDEVTYWKSRLNRTFYIDYYLDEDYRAIELAKIIVQMNAEEKDIPTESLKPIYLWIFSGGGDGTQCTALCDVIEASRIPIVTVNMGIAMSSGFLIFLAGKRRYCLPQGCFLVHGGFVQLQGTPEQVSEAHKSYQKELKRMKDYVISHTSIDEKLFNKNKAKDWYIEGREEIERLGVATVIDKFEEIV